MKKEFQSELASLLNRHSMERRAGSTPDFILADYLIDCLTLLGKTVGTRDEWYGHDKQTDAILPVMEEAEKRAMRPITDADIIATSDESYNLGRKHGIQEALALIPSARYEALEEARLATCWLCADGESVIQHSDSGEYYHPSRSHEFGLSEKRRALDAHSCFANRIRQIQAQDENRETQ